MSSVNPSTSLEAKIVVLGSQGVGKTSLVHRYVKNAFLPPSKSQSTVGASFLTTRVSDPESGATIRLQIWDTAGQERFRSISKLYYRGAHAAILCYDVSSAKSFEDMGRWLKELKLETGRQDMVLHIVGTKTDVIKEQPLKRQVPFEKCICYVTEQLYPEMGAALAASAGEPSLGAVAHGLNVPGFPLASPNSNRSSGFWAQEMVWDCCHEVSAKDGEGIEEVFRVITRKLVEQHHQRLEHLRSLQGVQSTRKSPENTDGDGREGLPDGYFDLPGQSKGSIKLGDKRRSWLGLPMTPNHGGEADAVIERRNASNGGCCRG